MKRKFVSILFALVLLLSLSLMTAAPAAAADREILNQTRLSAFSDAEGDDVVAEWNTNSDFVYEGDYSVHGVVPTNGDFFNIIHMDIGDGTPITLGEITSIQFMEYMVSAGGASGLSAAVILFLNDPATDPPVEGVNPPWAGYEDGMTFHNNGTPAPVGEWSVRDLSDVAQNWEGYADSVGTGTVEPLSYWTAHADFADWEVVWVSVAVGAGEWAGYEGYIDNVMVEWTGGVDTYLTEPRIVNTATAQKGYNYIQDAIDDPETVATHTISVAAGTYTENVNVNKQLTLTGDTATPSNVVVDASGTGNAITLSANGITLEGFKATGSEVGYAGISVESSNNIIINNDASGNGHHGILLLDSSSGNAITGNAANNNASVGIHLYDHNTGNTIMGNTANYNTHDGINLDHASNSNTITGNTANGNGTVGIGIVDSDGNTIRGNTANDNNNGISLTHRVGDLDTGCTDTTIEDNTANHNWVDGIRLAMSDGNTIKDNTANSNGRDGIRIDEGSDSNTITGNTASGNDGSYGTAQWNAAGIEIQVDSSANNTITGNTLTNNQEGILIKSNAGTGNTAHFNNIYDNIRYGIEAGVAVDATMNWWGDVAGPYHESNPYKAQTGGDRVSNNVDYIPWLIQVELVEGWNILSWPISSDWDEEGEPPGWMDPVYYFNSSTQYWGTPADWSGYTPLDAMYIKVDLTGLTAPVTISYAVSSDASFPSQKEMKRGWNLVGLAELHPMAVEDALFDAYYGTGEANLVGYSKVISPAVNQPQWTYLRDGQPSVPIAKLIFKRSLRRAVEECMLDGSSLKECLENWATVEEYIFDGVEGYLVEECLAYCSEYCRGDMTCTEECIILLLGDEDGLCFDEWDRFDAQCLNGRCSLRCLGRYMLGKPMWPTKGYWVYMVNDGWLGGFTSTPIVEVAKPIPGP